MLSCEYIKFWVHNDSKRTYRILQATVRLAKISAEILILHFGSQNFSPQKNPCSTQFNHREFKKKQCLPRAEAETEVDTDDSVFNYTVIRDLRTHI